MTLGYKGGAGTLLMDGKIYCFDRTAHVYVEKKVIRRLSSEQKFGWMRNIAESDERRPWCDERRCKREWTT
jgi:hypothetical protein